MKQAVRLVAGLFCLSLLLLAIGAAAQDQYTEGKVERVVLLRILPGHGTAAWADIKNNLQPVWEAEKSQRAYRGLCALPQPDQRPSRRLGLGLEITYKNMAALDGLGMKVLDLRMKQFGDRSKEQKVIDKRVENMEVVASYLTRDVTLK